MAAIAELADAHRRRWPDMTAMAELADGSVVLRMPLSAFSGRMDAPAKLAERLESRGTHKLVVSITPPAWVDHDMAQRLLEFFEEEFNAEAVGAIARGIEGSTVFMLTTVPNGWRPGDDTVTQEPGHAAAVAPKRATIVGALTARLDPQFGLYTSYLLTKPGSPSQTSMPQLGTKPWQRRGIGGFLVALASATAEARGCPPDHYLQSAPLCQSFYYRRGFTALAYASWPPSLRALVSDRTIIDECCAMVQRREPEVPPKGPPGT